MGDTHSCGEADDEDDDVSGMQGQQSIGTLTAAVCLSRRGMLRGRVSPEERSPSQASDGDIRDPVAVQIHDSVDGLAEEFHLVVVAARRDSLRRWNTGTIRAQSGLFQRRAKSHDSVAGFCPF